MINITLWKADNYTYTAQKRKNVKFDTRTEMNLNIDERKYKLKFNPNASQKELIVLLKKLTAEMELDLL